MSFNFVVVDNVGMAVVCVEIDFPAEELVEKFLTYLPSSYPIVLDSCCYRRYGLYDGRYLVAAVSPVACLRVTEKAVELVQAGRSNLLSGDVFCCLDELLLKKKREDDTGTPFGAGLAAGFFAYDLARRIEPLPSTAQVPYELPQMLLCFYDAIVVHDYLQGTTTLYGEADAVARLHEDLVTANRWLRRAASSVVYKSNFRCAEYLMAVKRVKEYIREGDVYQVNLTQQFTIELNDYAIEDVFLAIRERFPVPFAAFFRSPDGVVVSASPESFLRKRASRLEAFPIKGTRPRGQDAAEDKLLAEQLRGSIKDVAENVMIVDLMRNDLGKLARIGSVDATRILQVETFPTVHHLVSRIACDLRSGVTFGDVLKSTFPSGSVTGAPKIRAMQVIEEVEAVRRGLSMGAIGWIGYNGNADLSVAIRTLFIKDGIGYINFGGAVVADSDPMDEYVESLVKARAIFSALGIVTG
ncbi:MAG: aminodeoxychorismate synthase component I [Acidobacteriota bacterium]|nr:aminodeoxychorismate synthase component I [Blastocatellia bacterium]MDW8411441.1 aminodeoxychorismate synthase component I [Acidobacteriota bacterium]